MYTLLGYQDALPLGLAIEIVSQGCERQSSSSALPDLVAGWLSRTFHTQTVEQLQL